MAGIAIMKNNARLFIGLKTDFSTQYSSATKLTQSIANAITPVIIAAPSQASDPDYKVANNSSIGELGGEAEDIDVTALDSEAKENEAGFVDNGTQDITINVVDKKAYSNLKKWQDNAADLVICQTRYSKAGKPVVGIMYEGIIKSAKLTEASVGGVMQINASIQVNGAIFDIVSQLSDETPAAGTASPHTINDPLS